VGGHPPPFACSLGPRDAQVAIVGDYWGEQDEMARRPFMGTSGQELTRLLGEAGFHRKDLFLTNVFALRPPNGNIEALCANKSTVGKDYCYAPLKTGAYIKQEFLPEVARLREELDAVRPNLVVALGNVACWALLGSAKISSIRGTITETYKGFLERPLKTLPTFHPSSIMANWSQRPIVLVDLMKAKREAGFAEIRRPRREVLVEPTLLDIYGWFERPAEIYAVDIETKSRQIEMIGFARSRGDALVVPFVDQTKPGQSYWPSLYEELLARQAAYAALASPVPKLFQNGLYDLQYLAREGCYPRNCLHDTMLLHHSLYPELQKGLGFLGSVYSNEQSWKLLRHDESNKKDD